MGLPEIIYDDSTDTEIDGYLNYHSLVELVSIPIIRHYIITPSYLKPRYLYKVLLAVIGLDRPTKFRVSKRMGISNDCCSKNIDYLFEAGYLLQVKRARLIIPFQKYKQDTGYKLSVKGKAAIYAIIKASLPVK